MNKVVHSSKKMDWGTPLDLFDQLDLEFNFDIDAAATAENKKCGSYFGPDHLFEEFRDGLTAKWSGTVWCNPPYGRDIKHWVAKAAREALENNTTSVLLVPARTDTKWWVLAQCASEIRFIEGRLKFEGAPDSAPFPSALLIFRGWKGRYRWWTA